MPKVINVWHKEISHRIPCLAEPLDLGLEFLNLALSKLGNKFIDMKLNPFVEGNFGGQQLDLFLEPGVLGFKKDCPDKMRTGVVIVFAHTRLGTCDPATSKPSIS